MIYKSRGNICLYCSDHATDRDVRGGYDEEAVEKALIRIFKGEI